MKMLFFLSITLTLTSVSCTVTNADLRGSKLQDRTKHIRPDNTTRVEIAFSLTAFNKLDSLKQELGTTFLLYMTWNDPRLAWNQIHTSIDVDNIVFYANEIWTPPLVVSNAIDDSVFLLRDDIFPMRVNYNGTVTWIPRLSPTTTCNVDTTFFPADTQICFINITSWVHSIEELNIVKSSHLPEVDYTTFYTEDKSWHLDGNDITVEVVNLTGGHGIKYHQITYKLKFLRNKRFHWVLLGTPGICLALLHVFVFVIPLKEGGARVSYATTILLAFTFYAGAFISILPPIFDEERKHVLGEGFYRVMICGTVITVVVIIQFLFTSILEAKKKEQEARKKEQEKERRGENTNTGEDKRDKKDCTHCSIWRFMLSSNVFFFLLFIVLYSKEIGHIRCVLNV